MKYRYDEYRGLIKFYQAFVSFLTPLYRYIVVDSFLMLRARDTSVSIVCLQSVEITFDTKSKVRKDIQCSFQHVRASGVMYLIEF